MLNSACVTARALCTGCMSRHHATHQPCVIVADSFPSLTCCVDLQYRIVKKLRNEVLTLKGDIDTLQRLQQENHQPDRLLSQQSM